MNPCKSQKIWLYKDGDNTRACQLIDETDWNMVLSGSDVNGPTERWTSKFLAIMDECIPSRKLRSKRSSNAETQYPISKSQKEQENRMLFSVQKTTEQSCSSAA